MRILHFKRGQDVISNWPFWIMFVVAVGVVGIIIVKIANVNVAEASRIPKDLEDELVLIPRFYNSEECFAYQDDVGRVHTKVIDPVKLNSGFTENCFPASNANYAFSLTLESDHPGLIGPGREYKIGPKKTSNYLSRYADKEIIEDVLIFAGGNKYEGKLKIRVKNVQ